MTDTSFPPAAEPAPAVGAADRRRRVVLVEDDPADTVLFEAMVGHADPAIEVVSVADIDAALEVTDDAGVDAVVLDLGLPGLVGFESLDLLVGQRPRLAIVVLTGWGDAAAGIEAVARGAQDYLVKGEVAGPTVARSIRFAVERRRNELATAAMAELQQRQQEQHRLERALLVDPSVRRADLSWTSRYIAARAGSVSGDFFDGVELPDGTVRLVIGDVAGHGADEAALGVSLRAGWRALTLTGLHPEDVLAGLEELLVAERPRGDEFATVCDLTLSPALDIITVRSAGHPPPILAGEGALPDAGARSPLGIRLGDRGLPGTVHRLPPEFSLVACTDGLFEVRDRSRSILAADAVPPAVEASLEGGQVDPDRLIAWFADHGDGGWRDDVAVLVVNGRAGGTG